jgi:hypothetical protein
MTDADLIAKLQAENAALREVLREYLELIDVYEVPALDLSSRARALLAEGK